MHMAYGEFLDLFGLEPSPETLRFWLLSHLITPDLEQRVIAKAKESDGCRNMQQNAGSFGFGREVDPAIAEDDA